MTRPSTTVRFSRSRGFSLLEVLIALIILSVGLLGLAALQAEGLRGSSSALRRIQAVTFVSDIADRMRANRTGIASYAVTLAGNGVDNGCADTMSGTTPVAASTCNTTQMAQHDVFIWKSEMTAMNGEFSGSIVRVGLAGSLEYTIRVQWRDRTTNATGGTIEAYTQNIQF